VCSWAFFQDAYSHSREQSRPPELTPTQMCVATHPTHVRLPALCQISICCGLTSSIATVRVLCVCVGGRLVTPWHLRDDGQGQKAEPAHSVLTALSSTSRHNGRAKRVQMRCSVPFSVLFNVVVAVSAAQLNLTHY
jgi:hypothetical protein